LRYPTRIGPSFPVVATRFSLLPYSTALKSLGKMFYSYPWRTSHVSSCIANVAAEFTER
jgi:hypothetical protein